MCWLCGRSGVSVVSGWCVWYVDCWCLLECIGLMMGLSLMVSLGVGGL